MLWFVSEREARSEKEPKTQLLTWCGYPIEEENEQEAAGAMWSKRKKVDR